MYLLVVYYKYPIGYLYAQTSLILKCHFPEEFPPKKMLNVTNTATKEFIPSVLNLGGTSPPCPLKSPN